MYKIFENERTITVSVEERTFQRLSSLFQVWNISWYTSSNLQACWHPKDPGTSRPSFPRLDENTHLAPYHHHLENSPDVSLENAIFVEMHAPNLEILQKLLYDTFIVWTLVMAQKCCDDRLEWKLGILLVSLHAFVKLSIFHELLDLRTVKNTCFHFGITEMWTFFVSEKWKWNQFSH